MSSSRSAAGARARLWNSEPGAFEGEGSFGARAAAACGSLALLALAASWILAEDPDIAFPDAVAKVEVDAGGDAETGDQAARRFVHEGTDRETFVGAYGGAPYTYPSRITVDDGRGTKLELPSVPWDARPFDHPIYYGIRVVRWNRSSPVGIMVDFTHNKAIARKKADAAAKGTIEGKPVAADAKVGDIFHHLEFTHGHNLLTLNALFRPGLGSALLKPYVGLGAGVSLPHSEAQFKGIAGRTYEYQYTGPNMQFVAGIELRIPRFTYFLEYKFAVAPYHVPLHGRDGDTLFVDLARQFARWWSGAAPERGWLSTRLVNHNIGAGMGVRVGDTVAVKPGGPALP